GYREDIDWLRAIAVLAVVAFHFETPGIFGGFVGVDIFFVISGYLITGIIQSELAAGHFSFARFYERRVRRLLPALYTLVVLTSASFALAVWLMRHEGSANAFFMSPPRAWEFLVGGIVAVEGFPVLRHRLAQTIARGIALLLLAIPILSLRQGPGFPGIN